MTRTPLEAARLALACLDLTSLNDDDTPARIEALCARADGPQGRAAAVCVWPRFARLARELLVPEVAVAAVANFPEGSSDVERAVRDTGEIVQAGAQEVDVVLPYRALLAGEDARCAELLRAVRRASKGLTLKVILETGELREDAWIERAARLALDEGADFLKTSTGKTAVSATPRAAELMLQTIVQRPQACNRTGFKASGGIRSVAEAGVYMDCVEALLGRAALSPKRFRLGASALLTDVLAVLAGSALPSHGPEGY